MEKCLKALHNHATAQSLKHSKQQAAEQEYTYWLGKRAISQLRRYFCSRRSSKEVSRMVISDRASMVKRKLFGVIKLYAGFQGQRNRTDKMIAD